MRLLGADARARFRANRAAMFGLGVIALLVLFAVLGPWLIPADPNASDFALPRSPLGGPPRPSLAHPLGTDTLFRDLLARLASGARISLTIAAVATAIAILVGVLVGGAAGLAEGTRYRAIDTLAMRGVDLALAFPYLLLVTAIGVALDHASWLTIALVLGLTSWVGLARVVRVKTMVIKRHEYVLAARALGAGEITIAFRHVLPALAGTLLVIGTHALGQMILAEAVLGYLTVGVGPPQASWGRMLQEAEHYLGARPLLVGAPALAMVLAVLGFTRVGEGLSQALDGRSPAQRATAPADPVLLAVLLVAIAAFSGSESISSPLARPPRSETNTLRIATSVSVTSLDPAVANDEATRSIDQLLYARLVTWNERGELVPDLTERFSIEDEGKRFRFVLKPDLVFHDLSPLVAADVKRSLERTLSPRTPCPAATAFSGLVGYDAFRRGEAPGIAGITTPGPLEVVMTLTDADASFISLLGLGFAAPVCEGGGDHAGPKGRPPCGAGPFRLARLDERQIVLDRFPRYHRAGAPKLDRIECDLGVAPITQRYRFERGDIDVIAELTGIDTERMAADERWQAYQGWLVKPTVQGLFLNTTMAPFDNRHVRRAVSLALEPSILSRIRPSLRPIDRILPEGIARPAEAPGRRHDLAAALEEMRLGGYAYDAASGSGGYPHAIDYWTTPGSLDQTVAEVYQQQLARIGIRIRLKLVSYASWLSAISTPRTVAMGWRPWQPDFPDPSAMIDATLTSGAISNQGTQNLAFFSNAEVDRLAEQAHREGDPQRRMAMYARIEEIVRDEAPWIPTYTSHILVVWQPYVRGFRPDPMMPWRLDQVSIGEVP